MDIIWRNRRIVLQLMCKCMFTYLNPKIIDKRRKYNFTVIQNKL